MKALFPNPVPDRRSVWPSGAGDRRRPLRDRRRSARLASVAGLWAGLAVAGWGSFAGPAASADVRDATGVAVIIGNGAYEHRDVPDVAYAKRDAAAFRRYAVEVLGLDPKNVIHVENATRRRLFDLLGTRRDPKGGLWSYLDPDGGSNVVVFYSGHGVPGTADGRGYLLPVDSDPKAAEEDGYPIDLLYENLGKLGAAGEMVSARVYLDACFSGGSHGGGLIGSASPVYVTAALPEGLSDRLTSLAASTGKQIASWDDEARHGLFTHHLLDALYGKGDADGDGVVTAGEAKAYLDRHMTRAARRQHRRVQHASLSGAPGAVLASAVAGVFPSRSGVDRTVDPGSGETGDGDGGGPPPPDDPAGIERDKYTVGLEAAFGAEDYPKVLSYAAKLDALGGALPARVDYFRGAALFRADRPGEAVAALKGYVERAGREGRYYREALGLLLEAEELLARETARERAEREKAERAERAREEAAREARAAASFEEALGLDYAARVGVQRGLASLGMEVGSADGVFGDRTRAALGRWQARRGLAATGYLTRDQAEALVAAGRRAEREKAERERAVGRVFRDCPECPEMVVVPAGSFMMDSPQHDDEGPVHRVTIPAPFAVGKYEVTFSEWDACVSAGGCGGHRPDDEGWGRGARPAINVSWNDAKAYVGWLSGKTGKKYRLLSESEWEYAARAGTTTRYWWGNDIGRNRANCDGCGSRWDREKTAPVGSFKANVFGLHDMHGNAREWVADCWNDSYAGAPSDGSAWESGNCGRRVLRGGTWYDDPRYLRAASRVRYGSGYRGGSGSGIRVARMLAR